MIKPDPIELARRIAEDHVCIQLAKQIAKYAVAEEARENGIAAQIVPLQEEIANAEDERKRLLQVIRRAESKIRSLKEKRAKMPLALDELIGEIKRRKTVIRGRYVKALLLQKQREMNLVLPLNPTLVEVPSATNETNETTETNEHEQYEPTESTDSDSE